MRSFIILLLALLAVTAFGAGKKPIQKVPAHKPTAPKVPVKVGTKIPPGTGATVAGTTFVAPAETASTAPPGTGATVVGTTFVAPA
ncbi:unnamed protein product [Bursaphelenchus okinawaensis]|uniref:Uncharacterized protein n=1 Tax=Bursaphelenchus okinawaensis TaxID=465554 RepID=A0A811KBP1_9BILA|nr:unnamed protein product [Bursaphelenchus okinawaensis]CAG9097073.1 unnamed protein product [Bursaphelenchus okinawaensis]